MKTEQVLYSTSTIETQEGMFLHAIPYKRHFHYDGQIYLQSNLFFQPAPSRRRYFVSRVGTSGQGNEEVAGMDLVVEAGILQFGFDLDANHGAHMMELLKRHVIQLWT